MHFFQNFGALPGHRQISGYATNSNNGFHERIWIEQVISENLKKSSLFSIYREDSQLETYSN